MLDLMTTSRALLACLCLCAVASGCVASVADDDGVEVTSAALSNCSPTVPEAIAVPDGNKLAFCLGAAGVQIYACQTTASGGTAWVFQAPEADLLGRGGQISGAHYAGPTWEALDGSTVVGSRVSGVVVDPASIPWLLLQAASHSGEGRMAKVTYVQRLDTVGGLAPGAGCDAEHVGTLADVDYTARYAFFTAKKHTHSE